MKRYVLGFMLATALVAFPVSGVGAQADAGCDTLSADEAQVLLDSQPTYANQDRLDPDGDGIACEPDEIAATTTADVCDPADTTTGTADPSSADDAGDGSNADDSTAAGDDSAAANASGADDAAGGAADVADPCDPATGRGGSGVTVNGLPSTGVGAANPAALVALLAAASALGGVGAAAAARFRARA